MSAPIRPSTCAMLVLGSLSVIRSAAAACPVISTHTDASFTGGNFVTQAGFQETETAAASYVLTAADFPFRVQAVEMIFMTNGATVSTTTHYSIRIWQGTPATGTEIATRSSNGTTIPHLVIGPGTVGTDLAWTITPGDPGQVIVEDDGSHTFSVGYRVDQHNTPPTACSASPPTCCNAFPTTDASGLSNPPGNWIWAVTCAGSFCPSGWKRFSELGLCKPSGDWVLRVQRCRVATLDFDRDGDIDTGDLDQITVCATGPSVPGPPASGCAAAQFEAADTDHDGDVDQDDFAVFQRCYSGSNVPADPNCAN